MYEDNEVLADQARAGNRQATQKLWEQVNKILFSKAQGFLLRAGPDVCARCGVTLEDLQQECYFAFLDAVKAYKAEGGYKFTTYLNYSVKNRFRACAGIRSTRQDALNYADSLNAAVGEDGSDTERGELIEDRKAMAELIAVDDLAERSFLQKAVIAEIRNLPDIQKAIIRCRYYSKLTSPQTARVLGITPGEARRIEAKALRSLRKSRNLWQVWSGATTPR